MFLPVQAWLPFLNWCSARPVSNRGSRRPGGPECRIKGKDTIKLYKEGGGQRLSDAVEGNGEPSFCSKSKRSQLIPWAPSHTRAEYVRASATFHFIASRERSFAAVLPTIRGGVWSRHSDILQVFNSPMVVAPHSRYPPRFLTTPYLFAIDQLILSWTLRLNGGMFC